MTTNLLIFFAIPLAIIVISIALQKVLRNPFLVAGIIFSILLIIVLAFFDTIFLIAVIAYTILSFITAILTCLIRRFLRNQICNNEEEDNSNTQVDSSVNTLNAANDNDIYTCSSNNQGNFSGMTGSYTRWNNRRR